MAGKGTTVATHGDSEYEINPAARSLLAELSREVLDNGVAGEESMIAQIANATDWQGVSLGGKIDKFSEVAESDVVVMSVRARPSEIKGGADIYLVVTGYTADDSVMFEAATSSMTVMLQLLKLHALGAFPIVCHVEEARKPTRAGYYPQRLVVTGKLDQ